MKSLPNNLYSTALACMYVQPAQHVGCTAPAPPTPSHQTRVLARGASAGLPDISTMLLSMLSVAMVFSQGLSLPCSPLPYEIYWNVADQNPRGIDVAAFNIHVFPANYTQTGDACSNPGCKRWTQGVFPTISDSGTKVNGGVPQNANLSQHLEALSRDAVHWIPDPDWSGNAILDFEDWTTVWELNTGVAQSKVRIILVSSAVFLYGHQRQLAAMDTVQSSKTFSSSFFFSGCMLWIGPYITY